MNVVKMVLVSTITPVASLTIIFLVILFRKKISLGECFRPPRRSDITYYNSEMIHYENQSVVPDRNIEKNERDVEAYEEVLERGPKVHTGLNNMEETTVEGENKTQYATLSNDTRENEYLSAYASLQK
jgi:hypothetical protein